MRTIYTVHAHETVETFDSLAEAIRTWDGATYTYPSTGGITVQSWDEDGYCVREGWILHVRANGVVYLNPYLYS